MDNVIKSLIDLVKHYLQSEDTNPHLAPIFQNKEIASAVDKKKVSLFSWSNSFYGVSSRSDLTQDQRHSLVEQLVLAQEKQHPHIYKFGLAGNTTKHLKALNAAYSKMVSHSTQYLKTGLQKAYAADKNKPFKLDLTERKKLLAGIVVLVDSMRDSMNGAARVLYGNAYRKGKDQAVEKLNVLGQKTEGIGDISGDDLKLLNDWYDYHDEASKGLASDIKGKVETSLSGDYSNEKDFISKVREALESEKYRLPMYAWMGFSVAESAQVQSFKVFNKKTVADGGDEWKYGWLTMGDMIVCPICESYGNMEPRYLDEWPDEPGGVHVFCRCDLVPIAPAGA